MPFQYGNMHLPLIFNKKIVQDAPRSGAISIPDIFLYNTLFLKDYYVASPTKA